MQNSSSTQSCIFKWLFFFYMIIAEPYIHYIVFVFVHSIVRSFVTLTLWSSINFSPHSNTRLIQEQTLKKFYPNEKNNKVKRNLIKFIGNQIYSTEIKMAHQIQKLLRTTPNIMGRAFASSYNNVSGKRSSFFFYYWDNWTLHSRL